MLPVLDSGAAKPKKKKIAVYWVAGWPLLEIFRNYHKLLLIYTLIKQITQNSRNIHN